MKKVLLALLLVVSICSLLVVTASAEDDDHGSRNSCKDLPSWTTLKKALSDARAETNGGLGLDMWGTIVNRDGVVCAVAFTGADRGD